MKRSSNDIVFNVCNNTVLIIIGLVTLFPVYYVLAVSLTDQAEYLKSSFILFPKGFTIDNYKYMLSGMLLPRAMGVSAYLALFGTFFSLTVTSMLAYALSRKRMMGRKILQILILFTTLFNPGMIPGYILVKGLGLINSLWALILPSLSSGWYVFLMRSFFEGIPESLEEAAIIDGCGDIAVWVKVILPLSLPALATFGLFFAVGYWNTFFSALLYLNDAKRWPMQMVLRQMLTAASMDNESSAENIIVNPEVFKMASVMISIIPIMSVYPFLQKHFAKGVMLGSVKE